MGKKSKIRRLKDKLAFQKRQYGGLLDHQMKFAGDFTRDETINVNGKAGSVFFMWLLLLSTLHIPFLKPWLSILMGALLVYAMWDMRKYLMSVKNKKTNPAGKI